MNSTLQLCPFCGSLNHTKIGECPNIDPEQAAQAIGLTFVAVLREQLTPAQFAEVKRRNVTAPANSCASHDFLDANMVMAEAFEREGFDPYDPNDPETSELWSAAWEYAEPQLTDAPTGGEKK